MQGKCTEGHVWPTDRCNERLRRACCSLCAGLPRWQSDDLWEWIWSGNGQASSPIKIVKNENLIQKNKDLHFTWQFSQVPKHCSASEVLSMLFSRNHSIFHKKQWIMMNQSDVERSWHPKRHIKPVLCRCMHPYCTAPSRALFRCKWGQDEHQGTKLRDAISSAVHDQGIENGRQRAN